MRLRGFRGVTILLAAAATSAVLLFTACSSGLERTGSTLPIDTLPSALINLDQSDGARPDTIGKNELFVSEFGYSPYTNAVRIYQNQTFKRLGQITLGIDHPYGTWLDSHGLYVANDFGPSITEYSSANAKPFTYKAGMTSPVAVTSDLRGTVFEADSSGYVNEYSQKVNVVDTKCSVAGVPSGIAVDTASDVLVAYNLSGKGHIVEFTGFSSCKSRRLGVRLGTAGGMAVDRNNHIVICDESRHSVDIIKPPYRAVSGHLVAGWTGQPTDVKINAANNRAWIVSDGSVSKLYYPSGQPVASIVPGTYAYGAVDGSNYVP